MSFDLKNRRKREKSGKNGSITQAIDDLRACRGTQHLVHFGKHLQLRRVSAKFITTL